MNAAVDSIPVSLPAPCFPEHVSPVPHLRRRLHGDRRGTFHRFWRLAVALAGLVLLSGARADEVENPKEVAGFWGLVTGQVKSAQADGRAFVLVITKAEFDPASSALKVNAPLIGKELTIGTRMPKKDEVSYPNPDDVAYIKTLKPGMAITVKIFAPRSSPQVLRIQAPGKSA